VKLLAIRGENLASLAGAFAVPLDEAPLGGSGLFAITGPTGAGKSTLLDAMCLALFDQVPRLEGRNNAAVGRLDDDPRARLASHDVRSILRRGTAAGFAEVDYLGRDGLKYRARWGVRRARERVDGAYQNQEMSVVELGTGTSLGRTKTEVLAEIQRTLGLSYQQFRRSALLAQGDFAAFLRAGTEDRASLLEQMTGTELYSKLSIAAFRRNKEAQEELRGLESELGAVQMLTPEARAELEAGLPRLDAARQRAREDLEQLEGARRWFEERDKLAAAEREALAAERAAEEAEAGAAGEREALAQVEQARELRPLLDAESAARLALTQAEARRAELAATAVAAIARRDAAVIDLAAREAALQEARAQLAAASPELERAGQLDTVVDDEVRRHHAAGVTAEAAEKARDDAAAEVQRADALIEISTRRAEELDVWFAAKPVPAALAAQWPRWQEALKRHAEGLRAEQGASAKRDELQKAQTRSAEAHGRAREAEARAEEARRLAEGALREIEEAAQRGAMAPEQHEERERLRADRERLTALETLVERAIERRAVALREAEAEGAARAAAEKAAGEALESEMLALRLDAAHDEAERAAKRARAVQDLAGHRAALREGEACPLCGADEHPYVRAGWPVAELVSSQEARVAELQRERTAAQKRAATLRAQAVAGDRQAGEAAQRARQASDEHTRLAERWSRDIAVLGLAAPAPDALGAEAARAALTSLDQRLGEIAAAESRAAALEKQLKARLRDLGARREEHEKARDAREQAERALAEVARLAEQNEERAAQARVDHERAAAELAQPLAAGAEGWQARLAADPERFAEHCARAVADHQARVTERGALDRELTAQRAQREGALARLAERSALAAQRLAERDALAQRLAATRAERATLLEGRAVAAVRGALEARLRSAEAALEPARLAERTLTRAATDAELDARGAEEATRDRAATLDRAAQALADALAALGLDLPTLSARLAHDEGWLAATRTAIEARAQALVQARAVRGERVRAREAHEAGGRPAFDEPALQARLAPALAELDRATQAGAAARAALDRDDEAARQRSGKAAELDRRRRLAERWKAIDELIGSADGKKFKVFAQSLTLEALLTHANEHLGELAPRYRLMRVPGHDLDLQIIDQDMADEIRSTSSLSGGESFLVSLALALGLSSLASHDVRIETLFIDEGFGSLDPETLDMALAALETLQATGRQIGLISHVSGLAEQIGVEVRVERLGGGRSRVRLQSASAEAAAPAPSPLAGPAKATPKKRPRKAAGSAA
jgi:exonuclease SbcC